MSSLVTLAIIQVFNNHMWLMRTTLESTYLEHFYHSGMYYWTMLIYLKVFCR